MLGNYGLVGYYQSHASVSHGMGLIKGATVRHRCSSCIISSRNIIQSDIGYRQRKIEPPYLPIKEMVHCYLVVMLK